MIESMTTDTQPEAGYHHGDLPNALLAAVGDIVEEKGAANVSLREAARRAGVSHSAPAHHFGDKDGLIAAYCHQGFGLLAQRMAAQFAELDDADLEARVAAAGKAYVRFAAENPAHFDVMFRTGLQSVSAAAHDELEEGGAMSLLQGLVAELVDAGTLESEDADVFAVSLWGIAHGLASLWVDGAIEQMYPEITLDELVERVFGPSQLGLRAIAVGGDALSS